MESVLIWVSRGALLLQFLLVGLLWLVAKRIDQKATDWLTSQFVKGAKWYLKGSQTFSWAQLVLQVMFVIPLFFDLVLFCLDG